MNNTWYVRQEGEVFGPASRDRILEMLREGRLTHDVDVAAAPQGPFAPLHSVGVFETVRPIAELTGRAVPAATATPAASPTPAPSPAVAEPATSEPRYLPDAVRSKYLTTLSEKGAVWVYLGGLFVVALVVPHVPGFEWLKAQSWGKWVILALFVISAGSLVETYKNWKAKRLLQHSDKMLEVMYNEYRPISVVMSFLGWVVFLGVMAYMLGWFA